MISTTELHQLLKVPFLIEHFYEHKERNKEMTLWQFLSLHYAQSTDQDSDYEKDRKLPFKSHDCCNNTISIADLPKTHFQNILFQERLLFFEKNRYSCTDEAFRASSILDNIWQPPRTV